MPTFKLTIEYDGTDFCGWQTQPGLRTVQGELETALSQIIQRKITIHGAGRTDAGVHALGQVASFQCETPRTCEELLRGGNSLLPPDVALRHVEIVPDGFHARHSAIFRRYEYVIHNSPARPALDRHRLAWIAFPLDFDRMAQGCELLKGEHDFSAFRSSLCEAKRTTLTLSEVQIAASGERILLQFGCRSFLMNMVRIMAGTLIEIGRKKLEPCCIQRMLETGMRDSGGPTAPACGLTLIGIRYDIAELR
ncbi:tRNA pseudouridine(38-40) synthase TruA [Candidatus Sumerlaeota bacterium]|nr:tRNA pseudouridine(38-40) synthase TruA [Candidatus Sumerlaeota bacterium]